MCKPFSKKSCHLGYIFLTFFILCTIWSKVYPYEKEIFDLHMNLLKLTYPGFKGYDLMSLIWAGVLSFLYGYVISVICIHLHHGCKSGGCDSKEMNGCCKKEELSGCCKK